MLYFIGAIPLLTIPFFIKQFPESLSYYLAKKQVGKVVEILNKVKPDGNFKETDDYQLHCSGKEQEKDFRLKSYLRIIELLVRLPFGLRYSVQ